MSGTGKRGADKLNMIGIVTVGVCGAVLTYVSVVLLEAFYMDETAEIEAQRAFEADSSLRNTVRTSQLTNLDGTREGTIAIDRAMQLVIDDAQRDPSLLVPALGPSRTPTVVAEYGRPPTLPAGGAAPAPAEPAEPAPAPADDATAPAGDATAPAPAAPADAAAPAPTPATATPPAATPTPAPAPASGTPAAPGGAAPQGGNGP